MTSSAPRYDPRVLAAVRSLDDEREPIAEVCRRVGDEMARLGLPRPSYVHLRRHIKAERELRRELRNAAGDLVSEIARGRAPRVDISMGRVREARLTADVRRKS